MPIRYSPVIAFLAAAACGPSVPNDDGGGSGGSGSGGVSSTTSDGDVGGSSSGGSTAAEATSGGGGSSSTGIAESTGPAPEGCSAQQPGECTQVEGCENVSGSDVSPTDTPGEFYCSDLATPFACAESTCMRFSGILCEESSDRMSWVIERCIPEGWTPCPNAVCGAP